MCHLALLPPGSVIMLGSNAAIPHRTGEGDTDLTAGYFADSLHSAGPRFERVIDRSISGV